MLAGQAASLVSAVEELGHVGDRVVSPVVVVPMPGRPERQGETEWSLTPGAFSTDQRTGAHHGVRRDHYCPSRGVASLDRSSSLFTDPPVALFTSIAWDNGDGTISAVNVWDNPSAVADFFLGRVEPVIAAEGKPEYIPVRHGEPVASHFRRASHG